jgi:Cu(I)/Ag(I) efflux system periplasmic protein CusF
MKYRFLVRAALVITLGLPPMVAGAQTDDFVNGLVTKIDESAGRIVIKDRIASTAISRSQRSKKPSEN